MHIVNIMFSRGLGGIEQSFIDYCDSIKLHGHKVTAIIYPESAIKQLLLGKGINVIGVKNLGVWDIFAKSYLKKILKQIKADAIISHGNRAICLAKPPAKSIACPIIGVTHNYSIKHLIDLDGVFATTFDLRQKVLAAGRAERTVFQIPNMIRLPEAEAKTNDLHTPPVVGTMGRFVKKKGFDVFLKSIALLKYEGIDMKAIIGGSGEEEANLKELAKSLRIEDVVTFSGWVKNKAELFDNIDIFCLPSLHEPFGIILLEAFASGIPVITSDSEGPSEIATHDYDAMIVPKNNEAVMAEAIKNLLKNNQNMKKIAQNAQKTVKNYAIENVGKKICDALEIIIAARK
jgi:glycosyltransferase involved in cell wall biosynthesis